MTPQSIIIAACLALGASPGVEGATPPVGERFPTVRGNSLAREAVVLPGALAGEPSVLLVAYKRKAQEDVDRWRLLIESRFPDLSWLEVPTISSAVWRPFAGWIDNGMRGGVPRPLWAKVVTVYDDAAVVKRFLGRSPAPVAHVVLLDAEGRVLFFDGAGFSERGAADLSRAVRHILGREP